MALITRSGVIWPRPQFDAIRGNWRPFEAATSSLVFLEFTNQTRLKTRFECLTVRWKVQDFQKLSVIFRDFQRLSRLSVIFRDFQRLSRLSVILRLSETFIDFQGIHEVLDAKDECLMLSVKYLNKGRNNKNNFQTCRTVRDTLSRSKTVLKRN